MVVGLTGATTEAIQEVAVVWTETEVAAMAVVWKAVGWVAEVQAVAPLAAEAMASAARVAVEAAGVRTEEGQAGRMAAEAPEATLAAVQVAEALAAEGPPEQVTMEVAGKAMVGGWAVRRAVELTERHERRRRPEAQ